MADSTLMRMDSALRKQQLALAELIDIALHAVRESGETSVAAMHLQTRLQALADSLQPAAVHEARAAAQVSSIGTRRKS